jgi:hypothetical protein
MPATSYSATHEPTVAQYVIINLRNRTAEIYANPDVGAGTYPSPEIIQADGTISFSAGGAQVFDVVLMSVLP